MLFRFIARLGLDVSEFVAGAKKATATAEKMKSDMSSQAGFIGGAFERAGSIAATAFSVSAITSYAQGLTATISQIKDMSELLGVSTDEAQALQSAANKAAQPFSKIVQAFQAVEQARAKAQAGDKNASLMFSVLGIDPSKGSAKDIITAALAASERGAHQNAAAFDLLGTNVNRVRLTFDELSKAAPVQLISEEQIEKIDGAVKKLEEAKRRIDVLAVPYLASILDAAASAAENPSTVLNEYAATLANLNPMTRMMGLDATDLLPVDRTAGGADLRPLDLEAALRRRSAASQPDTAERLLERIAAANEATLSTLESATKQ